MPRLLLVSIQVIARIMALIDSKQELISLKVQNNAKVNLALPEDGISPGQACVFYCKDQFGHKVLGGGWIKE